MTCVRITHRPSSTVLAEGPKGWGITPFEGNYYVSRKYLKTDGFKANFIPGLCLYKFLYVWLDLQLPDGDKVRPRLALLATQSAVPVYLVSRRPAQKSSRVIDRGI